MHLFGRPHSGIVQSLEYFFIIQHFCLLFHFNQELASKCHFKNLFTVVFFNCSLVNIIAPVSDPAWSLITWESRNKRNKGETVAVSEQMWGFRSTSCHFISADCTFLSIPGTQMLRSIIRLASSAGLADQLIAP